MSGTIFSEDALRQDKFQLTRHLLLGMWLSFLVLAGLWGNVDYAIRWFDWHGLTWISEAPVLIKWFVAAAAITVLLLIMAPKPLTSLAALGITVFVGFSIMLVNHVISFALDSSFGRWGLFGRFGCVIDYGWLGNLIGAEIQYPDVARIVTYSSLGYAVTQFRGIKVAIPTSIAIALVDSILGWVTISLAFTLRSGIYFPLGIPEVWALLMQVGLLTLLGLVGALVALFRRPAAPLTRRSRRYRPARRIAAHRSLG